jgi:hypothetical protein
MHALQDYTFSPPRLNGDAYEVQVRHGHEAGPTVASLAFAAKPGEAGSPHHGYHQILGAQVHPDHAGAGIYERMLQLASMFVAKHGAQGLVNPSEALERAEDEDETNEEHLDHEFSVEFKRWLKARDLGQDYERPDAFDFNKAETRIAGNLVTGGSSNAHHEIARQMAAQDPQDAPEFKAARFLAGGEAADDDAVRLALILYDNDMELAALRAYGMPRNDHYRGLLRAAQAMLNTTGQLAKTDLEPTAIPRDIRPALPEAEEVVAALKRAQEEGAIEDVQLDPAAKHSKGTAIATDPKDGTKWLIKPGSGKLSPAAGVRDELATQSQREVAFYKVAETLGVGSFYPEAQLVLMDGREVAVLKLLGTDYKGVDKRRKEGLDVAKLFRPHLDEGSLYKWAFLDWVLGNPDSHANNVMVDDDLDVQLIDHGSAFAGQSFDPANDRKSFIPFYLRAWTDNNWADMDAEERIDEMPIQTTDIDAEFNAWVDGINVAEIEQILSSYGIAHGAVIDRLKTLKAADDKALALRELWAGA